MPIFVHQGRRDISLPIDNMNIMRWYTNRCKHCRTNYAYQISGPILDERNDKDYCFGCYGSIRAALQKVPVRFRFEFVPYHHVSLDQLEQWEAEEIEERKRNVGNLLPLIRRVFAGLYDPILKESSRYNIIKGKGEHSDKTFSYEYWPSKRNEAKICIGVEVDLETDMLIVCDEFHN